MHGTRRLKACQSLVGADWHERRQMFVQLCPVHWNMMAYKRSSLSLASVMLIMAKS
jgi:hypothetical protein